MIEATKSELTMSDADCYNIIRLLVEGQGTLTTIEAVNVVLNNSRNYPSTEQAHAMIHAFDPNDNGIPGETCHNWGSFGDWMASFMLNNRPCAFYRNTVAVQPPHDVLGMPGYSTTYYGLYWRQTYTYAEARPIIAKFLIGNMGALGRHPVGVLNSDDPYARRENYEIVEVLGNRAHLRSEAMRRWGRLIKLAPVVGRWALVLKPWYQEVSLKPEIGSAWKACRDRFEGMQAEEERDVRQRVE